MKREKDTMIRIWTLSLCAAVVALVGQSENALAQNANAPQEPQFTSELSPEPAEKSIQTAAITTNEKEFNSVLFTYWELTAIRDALEARGLTRAPTQSELQYDMENNNDAAIPMPPPEERYVALSGIVYKARNDWTIWLNGIRVSPDAIPKEVLDLKVYSNYIEFKWFDEYTNRILPIRLRSHQRFNIDTRIFLPG